MDMTVAATAPGRTRPGGQLLVLLGVAAVLTGAVALYTINHLKDAVIARALTGRPAGLGTALGGAMGPVDAVLVLLAAASVVALAWPEWRGRAWTRFLADLSHGQALACLLIVTAWCGQGYLSPGVMLGGDTATHVSRFLEVSRALEAGQVPHWTNYQYAGAPLIWFTGPLLYLAGGALTVLTGDATVAAKLLLFVLHVASGLLFFAWMRRIAVRPLPALLAACAFACAFAHLHLFLFRGVFPQAFTLAFLPLLFFAADGLMRRVGSRAVNAALFALSTAGLILNHQPHALYAAFYLAVFGAGALWTRAWEVRNLPALVVAGVAGAVTSAMAVVPTLAESGWVMLEPEGALFNLQLPTPIRLLHLVLWRDTRTTWGFDYWAYLGLFIVVAGAAGIAGAVRGRLPHGPGRFAPGACACLFIGLFVYSQVVRDIQFTLLFGALMGALGFGWAMEAGRLPGRWLLLAATVAVADLASTSVQPVLRTDKGYLIDAGRFLERTAPNDRVVELSPRPAGGLDADIGPDGSPISYEATVQRVAGNHNMAATWVHNPLEVTAKRAGFELADTGTLSPDTRTLLALFNVHRLVCHDSVSNGCSANLSGVETQGVLGRVVTVPQATPAVFSTRLVGLPEDPGLVKPMFWDQDFDYGITGRPAAVAAWLDRFVAAEQPNLATRTAVALPVDGKVDDVAPAGPAPARPFVITGYDVTLGDVRLSFDAPAAGYVQLAHPWIPSTVVTVNGQVVQPLRGALNLLVVPVPAGAGTILLRDGWTPVRAASAVVTVLGLVLIPPGAWLLFGERRRRVALR